MNWQESIGYVASGLTFMTFYMKAMLPLRYVALRPASASHDRAAMSAMARLVMSRAIDMPNPGFW
jgi:hypothetical protein